MFEDKKGEEFVRFHAEKDLDSTIEDTEKRLLKGKGPGRAPGEMTRETISKRATTISSSGAAATISRSVRIRLSISASR